MVPNYKRFILAFKTSRLNSSNASNSFVNDGLTFKQPDSKAAVDTIDDVEQIPDYIDNNSTTNGHNDPNVPAPILAFESNIASSSVVVSPSGMSANN